MKIGVQTGGLEERFGIEGTYQIVKEAGFDAVDVNLDHLFAGHDIRKHLRSPLMDGPEDELLKACDVWRDAALKYGIDNYQAHAPFPSVLPPDPEFPDYNAYILEALKKTIKCCAYIGCKKLVVHPFYYKLPDTLEASEEFEMNVRSYSALAETAKEHGVMVLLENMFSTYKGKPYAACCSDIHYAETLIDTLNGLAGGKVFGFCLDTGHLLLCSHDALAVMRRLGDRIEAIHVHDNNGEKDQHIAPYMGIADWNRFIRGLAEIGYDKTLSFETFHVCDLFDNELIPDVLRLIERTGRMFARRASELRSEMIK
ncbi:MAG: sugar phosphate isomerase/epimerase [Clostridia bacterium]|nr:sugar phosphate isomerase/epimerase [Clostridia bacterium]